MVKMSNLRIGRQVEAKQSFGECVEEITQETLNCVLDQRDGDTRAVGAV
jgi:hypothetical protein